MGKRKYNGGAPPLKDLSGRRFGKLVVIRRELRASRKTWWLCRCDCGVEKVIAGSGLTKRHLGIDRGTKSCGCSTAEFISQKNIRHGHSSGGEKTKEYMVWCGMVERCTSPSNKRWPDYGGRGISVCERWLVFANFINDMGNRPSPDHQIDRIDNDGNYEPGNVQWVTRTKNARNTRRSRVFELCGRTMCIAELAEESGIPYAVLYFRLVTNEWSVDRAMTEPVRRASLAIENTVEMELEAAKPN